MTYLDGICSHPSRTVAAVGVAIGLWTRAVSARLRSHRRLGSTYWSLCSSTPMLRSRWPPIRASRRPAPLLDSFRQKVTEATPGYDHRNGWRRSDDCPPRAPSTRWGCAGAPTAPSGCRRPLPCLRPHKAHGLCIHFSVDSLLHSIQNVLCYLQGRVCQRVD